MTRPRRKTALVIVATCLVACGEVGGDAIVRSGEARPDAAPSSAPPSSASSAPEIDPIAGCPPGVAGLGCAGAQNLGGAPNLGAPYPGGAPDQSPSSDRGGTPTDSRDIRDGRTAPQVSGARLPNRNSSRAATRD